MLRSLGSLLFTYLLIGVSVCAASFEPRAAYGEPCDQTDLCDPLADLTCVTSESVPDFGNCGCSDPDSMIFEAERNMCVSLSGEEGSCFLEPIDNFQRSCVPNAECVVRPSEGPVTPSLIGYCRCSAGFTAYEDRTCGSPLYTQGYGAPCNASHYCSIPATLQCLDGSCDCMFPDTMTYVEREGGCRSLALPDSLCHIEPGNGVQFQCIENTECLPNPENPSGVIGYCACLTGYEELDTGTCLRLESGAGYAEACDMELDLHCDHYADLACGPDGFCTCADPGFMTYDPEAGKCVSLEGLSGNCSLEPLNDYERTCVANAECVPRPEDDQIGYCVCSSGFTAYADHTCGPRVLTQSFEQPCNSSHFCNNQAILWCVEGECACTYEDTMVFDEVEGACLSLADPLSSCHIVPIGGIQHRCIPNADCLPDLEQDPSGKSGHCACSLDFVPYLDRSCGPIVVQSFGQSCNASHVCKAEDIISCSEESACTCLNNTWTFYEEGSEACVSYAGPGSECYTKPFEGIQIGCSRYSGCLPHADLESHLGYCACLPGYALYGNMTCGVPLTEQPYEGICNSTWTCSSEALLACDESQGMCLCKYDEDAYEDEAEKCLSPLGGLCFSEPVNGEWRSCDEAGTCTLLENNPIYGICTAEGSSAPSTDGTTLTSSLPTDGTTLTSSLPTDATTTNGTTLTSSLPTDTTTIEATTFTSSPLISTDATTVSSSSSTDTDTSTSCGNISGNSIFVSAFSVFLQVLMYAFCQY